MHLPGEFSEFPSEVLSLRHDWRVPTVIIPKRTLGDGDPIFVDEAVAHAILDRLLERAKVFHLEGRGDRKVPAARGGQPGDPSASKGRVSRNSSRT
jgi:hypothetical protein